MTSEASPQKAADRFPWRQVVLLLAVYATVLAFDIRKPWIGAHDWNGAAWSTAARQLLRRPIAETHAGVAIENGSGPLEPAKFYVHHPPLIVWLLAGAYQLLGVSEAAGRAVPIVFSLLGASCLTTLAFVLAGRSAALLALVVYLSMPIHLYYARMPNHEPLGMPLMLAAALAAVVWRRQKSALAFVCCCGCVFAACCSCWAAFFFALALGLSFYWGVDDRHSHRLFWGVGLSAAAALLFVLSHIRWVRPDGWIDLLSAFFIRSAPVSIGDWIARMLDTLARMTTPIAAALLLIHGVRAIRVDREIERAAAPLLIAGWANLLVFRQGAYQHEYYCYFLGAPAALLFGASFARGRAHAVDSKAMLAILLATIFLGVQTTAGLHRQQSNLYASDNAESNRLVVSLGAKIGEIFPSDARVLCDATPMGEHLGFYADRRVVFYAEQTEESLPGAVERADGVVFNTGLEVHRRHFTRVLQLASGRVLETIEFTIETHRFSAVRLRPTK